MKCWLILFLFVGVAWAEVQPEYPDLDLPERYTVVLKGRPVSKLFWRNGRPFGTLEELGPRLNLPSDGPMEVDILAVVAEKGYAAELREGVLTLAGLRAASRLGVKRAGPQTPTAPVLWWEQQGARARPDLPREELHGGHRLRQGPGAGGQRG